jgi:hypothetical protein
MRYLVVCPNYQPQSLHRHHGLATVANNSSHHIDMIYRLGLHPLHFLHLNHKLFQEIFPVLMLDPCDRLHVEVSRGFQISRLDNWGQIHSQAESVEWIENFTI